MCTITGSQGQAENLANWSCCLGGGRQKVWSLLVFQEKTELEREKFKGNKSQSLTAGAYLLLPSQKAISLVQQTVTPITPRQLSPALNSLLNKYLKSSLPQEKPGGTGSSQVAKEEVLEQFFLPSSCYGLNQVLQKSYVGVLIPSTLAFGCHQSSPNPIRLMSF